jgi:hypothetical protein
MLLASSVSSLFKWRQFEPEVILLAVGWYLRFSLSYRDVEELLVERGLHADRNYFDSCYFPVIEPMIAGGMFSPFCVSLNGYVKMASMPKSTSTTVAGRREAGPAGCWIS